MADRENAAVSIRSQPDALNGVRTVRRDVKHLLTRQRRLHRPVELARSDRRQNGVGIDPKLGAKAAADERADQPDVLDRNLEGPGDCVCPSPPKTCLAKQSGACSVGARERRVP